MTIQSFVSGLVAHNEAAYITIPNSSKLIESFLPAFEQLCQESPAYRQRWCTDLQASIRKRFDADCGLVWRNDESHDSKMFFHYRPTLPHELVMARVNMKPHESRLMFKCQQLYRQCYEQAHAVCIELDKELPGFGFEERFLDRKSDHVLRILRYLPGRKFYANPHFDMSFMTFAMFNGFLNAEHTEPSLFVDGHGVSLAKDQAYAFMGTKAQIFSDASLAGDYGLALEDNWIGLKSRIKGHYHYAQVENAQHVRYAVIFFSHLHLGLKLEEMSKIQKRLTKEYALR